MLKVTMVGTGSAFSKLYGNTSALVEFEDGYSLLIDCGFTTPTGLHNQNISLMDIDGVLITHIHADHVGGLEEVAFKNRYLHGGRKMDLLVPRAIAHELWENSLKGGLEYTEEGICTLDDYFNIKYLHTGQLNEKDICIIPTDHVQHKDSFAVGIGEELFYSSDTKFSRHLINMADVNYDYIFHDCQLFKGGVHASLDELLTLPEDIQRKTYLMHYGDNAEDFVRETGKMRFLEQGLEYLL